MRAQRQLDLSAAYCPASVRLPCGPPRRLHLCIRADGATILARCAGHTAIAAPPRKLSAVDVSAHAVSAAILLIIRIRVCGRASGARRTHQPPAPMIATRVSRQHSLRVALTTILHMHIYYTVY